MKIPSNGKVTVAIGSHTRSARIMQQMALVALILLLSGALAGCAGKKPVTVEPRVAPPAIAEAGVLSVGVDFSQPPFAGKVGENTAGLDIDVAAALADQLGLKVRFVNVAGSQITSALAAGKVDVALSARVDAVDVAGVALAGAYVNDGPALFVSVTDSSSVTSTYTLDTVPPGAIAVQRESESYWVLRSELGSESVAPYDSLRGALEAVAAGKAKVAAGDALVGAYIARDLPSIRFAGQAGDAQPLCVAVAADNSKLLAAVTSALDGLEMNGLLDSIRYKWAGRIPSLPAPDAGTIETSQPTP